MTSVETHRPVEPKRRHLALCLAALGSLLPPAFGQTPQPESPKPAVVVVLGASVSAGFVDFITSGPAVERNRTISLATACRAVWSRDRARVRDYSDTSLFLAPEEKGENAVKRALRARPDLVIAADFMFWFGYGRVPPTPGGEGDARLELQQKAFSLLDRFECPIVVGDYPDMRGAHPKMLSPGQIPAPEVLKALNERLYQWAEQRPRVHVFALSSWVANVKAEEESLVYDGERVPLSSEVLLQTDRLHATRLGMVLLQHRILPSVTAAVVEPSALLGGWPDLPELLDRLGADVDLPEPSAGAAAKKDKENAPSPAR